MSETDLIGTVPRPRVLSFGAGVQSHALLALLGQGKYPGEPPDELWFCDPMNERPQTYAFVERVTKPYCAALGIPFVTLHRSQGKVRGPDLLESYRLRQQFPLRRNRECTIDWKVDVMLKEAQRRNLNRCVHGVRIPSVSAQIAARKTGRDRLANPCAQCPDGAAVAIGIEKHIGISMDEIHRATSAFGEDWETKRYPLVDARLYRDQCVVICQQEFGEVPIKSGCWFCKFQRRAQWRDVWEERADGRWQRAVDWETEVIAAHGSAGCFIPMRRQGVIPHTLPEWAEIWAQGEQLTLPDLEPEGVCDGGYCMV